MYIIETQKVLDLKINLMASYVIVPQLGFYDPKHNLIILDLGHFQVTFFHILEIFFFPLLFIALQLSILGSVEILELATRSAKSV